MDKRGRPYFFAQLPPENDTVAIRGNFYSVVMTLSPKEERGLARALFININSIRQNYKNRRSWPGLEQALRVIEWDRRGRILTQRKVTTSYLAL